MAGDMAQAVEHLPRKHEALSSKPNSAKKKKKQTLNSTTASSKKFKREECSPMVTNIHEYA
jgi:hypothetical protein